MPKCDVIVIGSSAGGLKTLNILLSTIPLGFGGHIFIVNHSGDEGPGNLPAVLNRASTIPVIHASHRMPILPGRVYVAPPSQHMRLTAKEILLDAGPKENRHRPSVDILFRSAARAFGPRVIGVVLSGYLNDGSQGLKVIKEHGGLAIVQDPNDAIAPSMPLRALEETEADYVLPASQIGPKLVSLVNAGQKEAVVQTMQELDAQETGVTYSCPDCGGVLKEMRRGDLVHYVCRVGHRYTADALVEGQSEATERALWAGIRSLEEHAELSDRLADRSKSSNLSNRLSERARLAREHARLLEKLVEGQTAEIDTIDQETA